MWFWIYILKISVLSMLFDYFYLVQTLTFNIFLLEIFHRLYEKTQDHKNSVQAEIQERNKITEEISAVTNALQNAASVLLQDATRKAGQLEVGNGSDTVCGCLEYVLFYVGA